MNGFTNLDGNGTADDTLLDGLNYQGGTDLAGAAQILLRAGVGALLNAATGFGYPLTVSQVQTMVNNALASNDRDTMINVGKTLDGLNNGVCPLN